jgi:hypothetical protein
MGFLDFLFGKPKKYEHSRSNVPALPGDPGRRSPQASILSIYVGDVVTYDTTDFVVRNRYVYENHGFQWFSYQLVDTISGRKLWIDAEDDDELEVAINEPLKMDLALPIPNKLFHAGRSYYLDEHGFAKVLIESEDSPPRYAQVEFWDFCDDSEEHFLGVERWENEIEVSTGRSIEPYELTILAAGGSGYA